MHLYNSLDMCKQTERQRVTERNLSTLMHACCIYVAAQTMQLEAHQRKSAASSSAVPPFDICSGQWEWTPDSKDAYVLRPFNCMPCS